MTSGSPARRAILERGWYRGTWSDKDTWVITVAIRRPDGVILRRYVASIAGSHVTFTHRQAKAVRFVDRMEAEQTVCDVRLARMDLHPVRMVRLTRALEDRT